MSNLEAILNKTFELKLIEHKYSGSYKSAVDSCIVDQMQSDRQVIQGMLVNFIEDIKFEFPYLKTNKKFQEMCSNLERLDYRVYRVLPEAELRTLRKEIENYKGVEIQYRKNEKWNFDDVMARFFSALHKSGLDLDNDFVCRLIVAPALLK